MHKRFTLYTPLLFILLSLMTMYCTGNHKNYKSSMTDNLQNFEIIVRRMPNLPCTGTVYTLNDKKLTIDISENKSDKPGELDCIQNRVVEKELKKSEKLVQISQINLDNLEAIPNVICTGGISYSITLKKKGKEKAIIYYGCTKTFDKNTLFIVNYINSQVEKKYQIWF